MFDLIIKGGRVVDGTGADARVPRRRRHPRRPHRHVGALEGATRARSSTRADRIVAPGFIDPHTHFDAQLLWDGAGAAGARARRHHRRARQLLAVAGAAEGRRTAARSSACSSRSRRCRPPRSPAPSSGRGRSFGGYVDALAPQARAQRRAARRPQRDPPVGDGRRRAEARRDRERDRAMQDAAARLPRGRRRRPLAPASSTSTRSSARCRAATRTARSSTALAERARRVRPHAAGGAGVLRRPTSRSRASTSSRSSR